MHTHWKRLYIKPPDECVRSTQPTPYIHTVRACMARNHERVFQSNHCCTPATLQHNTINTAAKTFPITANPTPYTIATPIIKQTPTFTFHNDPASPSS